MVRLTVSSRWTKLCPGVVGLGLVSVFLAERLQGEDESGGHEGEGVGDHVIDGLHQWTHFWIHVGRRCPDVEDDSHGSGDEGLMHKVVERRGWSQSKNRDNL